VRVSMPRAPTIAEARSKRLKEGLRPDARNTEENQSVNEMERPGD
jgi:hypothetical protein